MRIQALRWIALVALLAIAVVAPSVQALAGTTEFGIAIPVTTSFAFSYLDVALEAYYRLAGAMFAWDLALRTNTSFSSLYIRNTLATAAALHLFVGHVTNLLPYFGSTYFTGGIGLSFGRLLVTRIQLGLALSIGGGSLYAFPEIRFQIGLDP